MIRQLPVPEGLDGERLDAALSRMLGLSRSAVGQLCEAGKVLVEGKAALKSARVSPGQWLEVDLPEPGPAITPTPVAGMKIIYDDEDLVAVDKPAGIAAHTGPGWDGPTITGALLAAGYRIATSGPPERQGIVQRLDVGTSGVMVVAKSETAYSALKRAFKLRQVTKIYHALVQGHPDPMSGTIDAPIGRHPSREFKMAVMAGGKAAVTHYDLLEVMPGTCLLRVQLETGRTHQIRVHMQAINHPIVGDPTYGPNQALANRLGLERQWLHAVSLTLAHPRSGQELNLTSEYPSDLQKALGILRQV